MKGKENTFLKCSDDMVFRMGQTKKERSTVTWYSDRLPTAGFEGTVLKLRFASRDLPCQHKYSHQDLKFVHSTEFAQRFQRVKKKGPED